MLVLYIHNYYDASIGSLICSLLPTVVTNVYIYLNNDAFHRAVGLNNCDREVLLLESLLAWIHGLNFTNSNCKSQ